MIGFADYRLGFVFEVGSLAPVKGHGASCLRKNSKSIVNIILEVNVHVK